MWYHLYMQVWLSLGSNLGDRAARLREALEAIAGLDQTKLKTVSSLYETEPVGPIEQPDYLNLAAEVETALGPLEFLEAVQDVERRLGRMPSKPLGPRKIDIDIVLWGQLVLESECLTLPHPEFRKRAFVLRPLAEIASEAVDPRTGLTVGELAGRPEAQGAVVKLDSDRPAAAITARSTRAHAAAGRQ